MGLLTKLRVRAKLSERAAAEKCGIARMTLRAAEEHPGSCRAATVARVAALYGWTATTFVYPDTENPQDSTVAVSHRVLRDGPNSWKVHFFDLVDSYRRSLDERLLILPPPRELPRKLHALLASIVVSLAQETGVAAPPWADCEIWLERPWFVAASEALKATALVESPLAFRRNNIFVLASVLERA